MRGVITKIFYDKGYAFIRGDDGVTRFMHATAVGTGLFSTIQRGAQVRFEHFAHEKGPRAVRVEVLGR